MNFTTTTVLLHFYSSIFLVFNVNVNIVFILLIKRREKEVHLCTMCSLTYSVLTSRRQDHPPVAHSLLLFGYSVVCCLGGTLYPFREREGEKRGSRNNPLSGNTHIDIFRYWHTLLYWFSFSTKKKSINFLVSYKQEVILDFAIVESERERDEWWNLARISRVTSPMSGVPSILIMNDSKMFFTNIKKRHRQKV